MKWEPVFIFIFLMSAVWGAAQTKSDFEIMAAKSRENLYQDPDAGIRSCKNISLRDDQDYEKIMIKSILAEAYSLKGNNGDAVRIALENVNATEELGKKEQLLVNLGVIKCFQDVNLYGQAEILLVPLLKEAGRIQNDKSSTAAKIYQLHAENLFALNRYDKALESITLSNRQIPVNAPESYLIFCLNKILTGRIYFQKKEYRTAGKSFDEVRMALKDHPQNRYLLAVTYWNQAELLFAQKEYRSATEILQKALEKLGNADFLILKNKIYAGLAKNHLALKENERHRAFQKKHDDAQTVIDENRNEAIRNIMELNQRFQTQKYTKYIAEKQQQNYIDGSIVLLIISAFLFLNYQENQKSKALTKQVLFFENQKMLFERKESKIIEPEKNIIKKALVIPKEKEDQILKKLRDFEESKEFLARNMSLALLAAQLETNTKYLSEVINKFKGKNFTTYINELKINYIAHLLSSDFTYLQYKISYLAEISGFTSHSTFTVVFKSVTGMSPNDYIQQVKKRNLR